MCAVRMMKTGGEQCPPGAADFALYAPSENRTARREYGAAGVARGRDTESVNPLERVYCDAP